MSTSKQTVGFICDDTLFMKPSDVDAAVLEGTVMAPAYPAPKPKRPRR